MPIPDMTKVFTSPLIKVFKSPFIVALLVLLGTRPAIAQTPQYWIHSPGITGVNNTFFHGSICEKFIFSYSAAEWAAAGLPPAIPYEVSSIWFRSNTPDVCTFTTFKVQIGHTSLAVPETNYLGNFDLGGPTTCLDESGFSVEFVAGPFGIVSEGWSRIDLTTPFIYNGSDNLVVLVEFTASCGIPLYGDLTTSTTRYSALVSEVSSTTFIWRPMFGISAVEEPPTAQFFADTDSLCAGGCINLINASSGSPTSYLWSFPGSTSPTIAGAIPGPVCYNLPGTYTYSLAAGNSLGSDTAFGSLVVEVPRQPDLGADTNYCEGLELTLSSAISIDQSIWSDGSTFPELTISEPGIYWLESDGYCSARDSIQVSETALPVLDLVPPDNSICEGDTLNLMAGDPSFQYTWNTGDTGASIAVLQSGFYSVTADNQGCTATSSVEVEFLVCGCSITVPNAFTPNQDGLNDVFRPIVKCGIDRYKLQVWNRWGALVYQSEDPFQGWDGTFLGKMQELGSYIWHLDVSFQDRGKTRTRNNSGTLTLLP